MFLLWLESFFLISSISSFMLEVSASTSLILVKTRMIWIFTLIAVGLLSTLDNMATPCSVNAIGTYRVPPQFEVPNWLLKFSNSCGLSSNIKSSGKRSIFLRTCLLSCLVSLDKVLPDRCPALLFGFLSGKFYC